MKSILISIKPKYVAKILNGEKTIEIRKTMPKCELPIDVYIYCTLSEENLVREEFTDEFALTHIWSKKELIKRNWLLNGKVVAKFTLNKCQEWHNYSWQEITEKGCITDEELRAYSKGHKSLYIWKISNLEIFDKPKELDDFEKVGSYNNPTIKCPKKERGICNYGKSLITGRWVGCEKARLTKAPQSWFYVESEEV